MSKVLVSEENLTSIANSIRAKNGTTTTYKPSEMSTAIDSLGGKASPNYLKFSGYGGSSLDLNWLDASNLTDLNNMFSNCSSLTSVNISVFAKATNITSTGSMFYYCSQLPDSMFDFTGYDTSHVAVMNTMFGFCQAVTKLDLSMFNTSNVTTMQQMFYKCTALKEVDLSNAVSTKVTLMANLFYDCNVLEKIDMRNFDFTKFAITSSYQNAFYNVPANCLIIVKDANNKQWFAKNFSTLTNVKTVDEL